MSAERLDSRASCRVNFSAGSAPRESETAAATCRGVPNKS
jgi:hypothetical protein